MATEVDKHGHYSSAHKPADEFWGIGIENESYIEVLEGYPTSLEFLLENQLRERYSVNYWKQYKPNEVAAVLKEWYLDMKAANYSKIRLPLLLNAHTFSKCDQNLQHTTLYDKETSSNPKFGGKTVMEMLKAENPEVFGSDNKWWIFDGDSIEITTQNFYCAKLEDVLEELRFYRQLWIHSLNDGLSKISNKHSVFSKPMCWVRKNYGFAVFATNPNNVSIFNNGTYHINLTAPTYLDKDCEIADREEFVRVHRNAARLFQWLSPFLVARYGSPDPLANMAVKSSMKRRFPVGSQRIAASRYVSLGTYDTTKMLTGKILTRSQKTITKKWLDEMYSSSDCSYSMLDILGFDINFNKFKNHGLELRIFDWFEDSELDNLMRLLIWMLEFGASEKEVPVPQESDVWNSVVSRAVWHGTDSLLTVKELNEFARVLNVEQLYPDRSATLDIITCFNRIFNAWADKYNYAPMGSITQKMIRRPLVRPLMPDIEYMKESEPVRKNFKNIVRVHGRIRGIIHREIQSSSYEEIHRHQIQCLPPLRTFSSHKKQQQQQKQPQQQQKQQQKSEKSLISGLVKKIFH
jgi:hypothetical protein